MGLRFHLRTLLGLAIAVRGASAQDSAVPLHDLTRRLVALQAVTGYEQPAVATVLRLLPGSQRDRAGNARLMLGGGGTPRRLVVCPLDEPGYVVGNIRDDGYLTLRRVGVVPPLFDQQLEGQRVTLQGTRGPRPGVVAVRSIHLTRGREGPPDAPFTVDDAYVDVGARSRAEVLALGIDVLTPVTLAKRPHLYGGGLLAGPSAGRRAACAALLTAVGAARMGARLIPGVTVGFVVEQRLGERGLATLANSSGPFDETIIVDGEPGERGKLVRRPDPETASRWPRLGPVTRLSLPVRYGGSPVETVALSDADSLQAALMRWIGGQP
jgi:putative aminopeptidase